MSTIYFTCFKIRDRGGSEALAGRETSRWNIYACGNTTGQFTLLDPFTATDIHIIVKLRSDEMLVIGFEPEGLSSDTDAKDQILKHHPGSDGRETWSLCSWAHSERGEIHIGEQLYCSSVKMLKFCCQNYSCCFPPRWSRDIFTSDQLNLTANVNSKYNFFFCCFTFFISEIFLFPEWDLVCWLPAYIQFFMFFKFDMLLIIYTLVWSAGRRGEEIWCSCLLCGYQGLWRAAGKGALVLICSSETPVKSVTECVLNAYIL